MRSYGGWRVAVAVMLMAAANHAFAGLGDVDMLGAPMATLALTVWIVVVLANAGALLQRRDLE